LPWLSVLTVAVRVTFWPGEAVNGLGATVVAVAAWATVMVAAAEAALAL
jgi:hypothetical protein